MLKSITGVYIGGIAAVSFADYICNFFLVCFIFDGGLVSCKTGYPRVPEGGGSLWAEGGYSFVIGMVLFCCQRIQHSAYADGGLLMPTAWGGGAVGFESAQRFKVKPLDNS